MNRLRRHKLKTLFNLPTKIIEADQGYVEAITNIVNHYKNPQLVVCRKSFTTLSPFFKYYTFDSDERSDHLAEINDLSRQGFDTIIGIGGGSKMDIAKLIRAKIATGMNIYESFYDEIGLLDLPIKHDVKLILIPTTAGSGSEVSRGAMLYDKASGRKRLIAGRALMADYAILDPALTLSLPKEQTFYCGMDALAHAIESYYSTNANPFMQTFAVRAINNIIGVFNGVLKYPENIEYRKAMLYASCFAGITISAGLGLCHSVAHAVSALTDISHGMAVASCLLPVMSFNSKRTPSMQSDKILWCRWLYDRISELFNTHGRVMCNIKPEQIPMIADFAYKDHCHKTNPVLVTYDDVIDLISSIFTDKIEIN